MLRELLGASVHSPAVLHTVKPEAPVEINVVVFLRNRKRIKCFCLQTIEPEDRGARLTVSFPLYAANALNCFLL